MKRVVCCLGRQLDACLEMNWQGGFFFKIARGMS
jgi:hypothetical protein